MEPSETRLVPSYRSAGGTSSHARHPGTDGDDSVGQDLDHEPRPGCHQGDHWSVGHANRAGVKKCPSGQLARGKKNLFFLIIGRSALIHASFLESELVFF